MPDFAIISPKLGLDESTPNVLLSEAFLARLDTTPVTEEIVMAEAAIVNLDSYGQEALEVKFRERLHRELDTWLDRLGNVMDDSVGPPTAGERKEKPSGLWGITQGIRGQREELMGTVAREWIEKEYAQYLDQEHAKCPICGKWLKRQDLCQRTLETMIGEVTIHRPYFYCSVCHHGFYPLDEALGLS